MNILRLGRRTLTKKQTYPAQMAGGGLAPGTHMADPAKLHTIFLTAVTKGEGDASIRTYHVFLTQRELLIANIPISNLHIHPSTEARTRNYSTAKQSNTGLLYKLYRQTL